MRFATLLFALLTAAFSTAVGQAAARYRPSPDTLRYESINSYLMYFVQGGDTLGQPVMTRTLEFRRLAPTSSGLHLWVHLEGTEPEPFRSQETYTITPWGRVVSVDGRPVSEVPNARVDVLPRFSTGGGALGPGAEWSDTLSFQRTEPYGHSYYDVRRRYRVVRMVDSASTTLALITAEGEIRLRQGGWQDSTQALVWWQEVAGPTADTVWFDTRAGRILASVAVMNLVGTGGFGPLGGGITMPSGLRSSIRLTPRR